MAASDWIKNSHLRPQDSQEYPPEVDDEILEGLHKLSFEELDHLADTIGARDNSGELLPPDEWSREQYIEILSEIGDMTKGQVQRIRAYLNITPKQQ